jgi:pimeloyl-ACP methyl ester carboxylesterase
LAILLQGILSAQEIAGDWQGTLKFGKNQIRVVVTIAKGANGGWTASEVTPDEGSNPVLASSVTFGGSTLKLAFDSIRASYEGILSESKNSFKGTLTQGSPVPLDLDRASDESSWRRDRTPHKIHFIEVDENVKLEVVDWGGSGRPLILLAGGNNHAHSFDKFGPKLTSAYRVYGISRRGSGASSAPPPTRANYVADRLGDDILSVIAALNLDRPILVGHSLAGQELSSVGSRHPGRVAGLIYLDAGYLYAYDPSPSDPSSPQPQREIATVQEAIRQGVESTRASTSQSSPSMRSRTSAGLLTLPNAPKRTHETLPFRERTRRPSRKACRQPRLSGLLMPITTCFVRMKRMSSVS